MTDKDKKKDKKKLDKLMREEGEDANRPFYDKVLKSGAFMKFVVGKDKARVATAMIYERVGDTEYFLGGFPLLRGAFHQIGEYFVLEFKGKNYFMDCLGSDMFTPAKDRKIGKIVEIVKFTDDDFRVRTRINKSFFTKKRIIKYADEPVALTNESEEVIMDDESGEPVMVKVPLRDGDDNIVYDEVVEEYREPKGVTQEGRDAIRIHNQTQDEIKKFKEKNEGFWEKFNKHGGMTIVGLAIVVLGMMIGMKMMTDAWVAGVSEISDEIKETNSNLKWWQQADALDKITDAVGERQDEKNAPPVK